MLWQETNPEEAQLARSLQRMWPHREHESGLLRGLMCWLGLHLWLQPDYTAFVRRNSVRFCLWCSSVEINGACIADLLLRSLVPLDLIS